jgi:hypothetical protein
MNIKVYIIWCLFIILLFIIKNILNINPHNIKEKYTKFNNPIKYQTEIHFITFWDKKNTIHKNRVKQKIKELNNEKIRIIKELKINKHDIKKVFKNVNSGGKHNNHDIDIYIIEVPNIYNTHKTHDNPNGENVNDFMYKLKLAARGDYKNFKSAHGSFNKNEVNDFFEEYFKLLGDFNNYEEVKSELNNSNIFWLYDRVSYHMFGKETDIDLVVDSIPATSFILRSLNINNKIMINVANKKIPIDLRDFDSNYYPTEWLQNIKNKNLYFKKNNIQIPDLENHFMLGLYHMYIHKNENQNNIRINTLKKMRGELGYKNIDITILFDFLNNNKYKIQKPLDNEVGFFIKELTRQGHTKNVYNYKNNIYYLYKNKNDFEKETYILLKLEKYNFTSKILYKNENSLILQLENVGKPLNEISTMELNKIDFKNQINYIDNILKKYNIIHNDINYHNITLKNNKLYLIDFEHSVLENNIDHRIKGDYYCKKFPKYNNNNNFTDYLRKNKCMNYK